MSHIQAPALRLALEYLSGATAGYTAKVEAIAAIEQALAQPGVAMIEVTNFQGGAVLISPSSIVTVTEAAASSQWHGIRSVIKLGNGAVIESSNTVQAIQKKLKEAYK